MITYQTLYLMIMFASFVVSLISLIIVIINTILRTKK